MCEKKKGEENEKWDRRADLARRDAEVWEIVNRERERERWGERE